MGFFGEYVYSEGSWGDAEAGTSYLRVEIYDSDIATVDFSSPGVPAGRLYLGVEPRDYYEDPTASEPIDAVEETEKLAQWARQIGGVTLSIDVLLPMLAKPGGDEEPIDVFVEETAVRLITTLGLPLPEELESLTA